MNSDKAWNSASPDSRTQAGIYQSSVLLWHQDSLVLFNTLCQSLEFSFDGFQDISRYLPKPGVAFAPEQPGFIRALCQSLEFSFAGFQDTSRYLPKPGEAFAPGQPCFIQYLVPKPGIQLHRIPGHKPVFTKALCCFGTGTALSYMLSYAKARNSALTDSRTQAGIYQSPVLLWHRNSLVLSFALCQSPVLLWHRDSLVLFNTLCQSPEFSFAGFQDTNWYFPKLCVALASGQPCRICCLMPKRKNTVFYFSSSLLIR